MEFCEHVGNAENYFMPNCTSQISYFLRYNDFNIPIMKIVDQVIKVIIT